MCLELDDIRGVYEECAPKMKGYLKKLGCKSEMLAEDLVHTVMEELLNHIADGNCLKGEKVGGFLFARVRFRLLDHIRKHKLEDTLREGHAGPAADGDTGQKVERVLSHLISCECLSERQRKTAVYRLFYGESEAGIANRFGVKSRHTVRKDWRAIAEYLRDKFDKEGIDLP